MGAFGSVQRASGKSSLSNELILLATIHDMYSILAHCRQLLKNFSLRTVRDICLIKT